MIRHIFFLSVALLSLFSCCTAKYQSVSVEQEGALNGFFSVSDSTLVRFSKGNLQYKPSDDVWRFAESQWQTMGQNNSMSSASYDDWLDLFRWGTSGWQSGAEHYLPWCNSNDKCSYVVADGDSIYDLTGTMAHADWGVHNAIQGGGDSAGLWRTLTIDEWQYLLEKRNGSVIGDSLHARYCMAQVHGVGGVLLFADNYKHPQEVPLPKYINECWHAYGNNAYTDKEWDAIEHAGAVFLPAAGRCDSTLLEDYGEYGYYWSTTHYEYTHCDAYLIDFCSRYLEPITYGNAHFGFSVRVVMEVGD